MWLMEFIAAWTYRSIDIHFPNPVSIDISGHTLWSPFHAKNMKVLVEICIGVVTSGVGCILSKQVPMGSRYDSAIAQTLFNGQTLSHFHNVDFSGIGPANLGVVVAQSPKGGPQAGDHIRHLNSGL
jgi:hypothetical protein